MTSKFQQRHYEAVAAIFAAERPGDNWDANKRVQHNLLLDKFVATFSADNSKFRIDLFVKAAGGRAA